VSLRRGGLRGHAARLELDICFKYRSERYPSMDHTE